MKQEPLNQQLLAVIKTKEMLRNEFKLRREQLSNQDTSEQIAVN
jgi:hypothetical protein